MIHHNKLVDVSIIIVSWNALEYLIKCLKSIYRHKGSQQYEIIVVDNASTDNSPEIIRKKFPEVRVIENKCNLGFAKANNIGIKNSSGKFLCFVNSDVELINDCISILLEYLENLQGVGIVGPKVLNSDHTLQNSVQGFPTIWNSFCRAIGLDTLFPKSRVFTGQLMSWWNHGKDRKVDILSGCFWMVRKKALEQVGLLDERFYIYAEDKDWCKRFSDAGWYVVFNPEAEIIHYGGASSANAPIKYYLEMQKANLQYWKNIIAGYSTIS